MSICSLGPRPERRSSPTFRLLAGLALTLGAVAIYSAYTAYQLRGLREIQTQTVDRNRTDSLLLLRIQNSLNSLAIAMRDMLDAAEPYPLTAWQPQVNRLRRDLEDAVDRERRFAPQSETSAQQKYLADSFRQFWDAFDRVFASARAGGEAEARTQIRMSLQARHAALTTAVARLLVLNNENEQQAAARTNAIYSGAERNVYLFASAMLIFIVLTSLYLVRQTQKLFEQLGELSGRRSELARQLISMQENTFRSISRELHDDFGQILTAIGVMLQRAGRRAGKEDSGLTGDLREVREVVQNTLEKVRDLSRALHPVVLEEIGLESAIELYLAQFERQTGIGVKYRKSGEKLQLTSEISVHLYRVLQESLNNVAKHSKAADAQVRLASSPTSVTLEIQDDGIGFQNEGKHGMGLITMRERIELVKGAIEISGAAGKGVLVRATVPVVSNPSGEARP